MVRAVRHLVLLWLAVFFVGCDSPSEPDDTPKTTQANILTFKATPSTVQVGQSTILSWAVENAVQVVLEDETGPILENAPLEGSHEVEPEVDTTWRLVATGTDGIEVTREVTIVVAPAEGPTVSLSADPETIPYGASATLRWESTDADRVILRAGDETLLDTTEELSGELVVKPGTATIYEITAIGADGESKASAQVVVEALIHFFHGPSERVPVGSSVGLSWKTEGAQSLTLRSPEGVQVEIEAGKIGEGMALAVVGESGIFELVARNGQAETKATLEVALLGKPLISQLTATPERVTRDELTSVTIGWEIEDATRAMIVVGEVETQLEGAQLTQGTLDVELDAATTVRLEATNAFGTSSRTLEIEAIEAAVVASFEAVPSRVGTGESFLLRWVADHSETVSLYKGSEELLSDSTQTTGSISQQIDGDTTFRLEARNALGSIRSQDLLVVVGAPIVDVFAADMAVAGPSESITLSWRVRGGQSVRVLDPAGAVVDGCTATATEEGSCTTKALEAQGTQIWTLEVENGAGVVTKELSLIVTDGPWIEGFAASPSALSEGEEVRFSWDVANDRQGREPTLSLVDQDGRTVDLAGAAVGKGHVDVVMDVAGTHVWTLTATTDGTTPAVASVNVEVVALPTLVAAASQPIFQIGVDEELHIDWVTTGAVALEILRLDGATSVVYTAPAGEVATGSWSVAPIHTDSRWRVVATNSLGTEVGVDIEVEILAPPASILSFTASQTNVASGAEVVLSWDTTGATTLSPVWGAPRTLADPADDFILLSGNAVELAPDASCAGCAWVSFPEGFAFPFDGEVHTGAHVVFNGGIGFGLDPEPGATWLPRELPTASRAAPHLAAYWSNYDIADIISHETRYELRGAGADRHLVVEWFAHEDIFSMGMFYNYYAFQAVLWENGAVDFRYQLDIEFRQTLLEEAVAGVQDTTGQAFHMYKDQTQWAYAGWEDLTIRYFEAEESAVGQRSVTVDKTTVFTLCAGEGLARQCESLTVFVD